MRASIAWIRELLPALAQVPVADLRERLTRAGLEVEAHLRFGEGLETVVVAQVTAIRPHPSRSGLRLVTVDRGGVQQEVVCGAPNVPAPGGLVVLAPLGTHLPAAAGGKGLTLVPRAIGGVNSEGMLCSEDELGLSFGGPKAGDAAAHDHGILLLPDGLCAPGTRLVDAIPAVMDDVFEIGVTPNRPDALSHVGLARELAALFHVPFELASGAPSLPVGTEKASDLVAVQIDAAARERCPYYAAAVALDLTVGPSPLAVRYRLHALGVRSISNIVDVTNLVLLHSGQPLHAFDLDLLAGRAIVVRLARAGERLRTLDGIEHELTTDDLVICDGQPNGGVPVALAGVMGGESTEIRATTRRVLLESAHFDARSVRRTARRHGFHTEASHRFERGIDPHGVRPSLDDALGKTVSLAGGRAALGLVEARGEAPKPVRIGLRPQRLEQLLGMAVPTEDTVSVLVRLGCVVSHEEGAGALAVTAPSHRPDLTREVDLIEEVARVLGYDRIPTRMPSIVPQGREGNEVLVRRLRHTACELGLSEMIHYGFASPRELALVHAPEPTVRVQNPLGEERSVMRTSLLPGLLGTLRRCRNRGERRFRGFELGTIFLAGGPEASFGLCDEQLVLTAVLAGPRDQWMGLPEDVDVWDCKGIACELVERVLRRSVAVEPFAAGTAPAHLHPRGAAQLRVGAEVVGVMGPLHPDVVSALELDGPAQVVELSVAKLLQLGAAVPAFSPLPTLPAVVRDLALETPEAVTAGDLLTSVRAGAGELCEAASVFDVYRGKGVAEGRKSVALRVVFRDPKGARTLVDAEVDACIARAVEKAGALGAVLRG